MICHRRLTDRPRPTTTPAPAGTQGPGTTPQWWSQNSPGVPGTAETGDAWGAQVRLADTDGDGRAELIAAAPGENAGDGALWLLPASRTGLLADGSRSYGAASLGAPVHGARFGAVLDE